VTDSLRPAEAAPQAWTAAAAGGQRAAGYPEVGGFHYLGIGEGGAAVEAARVAGVELVLLYAAYGRGGLNRFRQESVGRYLEDAMLGGLTRVRVIHGKGTGRLRKGLNAFFEIHPLVAGFQMASFEEGGAGATVVDLGSKPEPLSGGEAGAA